MTSSLIRKRSALTTDGLMPSHSFIKTGRTITKRWPKPAMAMYSLKTSKYSWTPSDFNWIGALGISRSGRRRTKHARAQNPKGHLASRTGTIPTVSKKPPTKTLKQQAAFSSGTARSPLLANTDPQALDLTAYHHDQLMAVLIRPRSVPPPHSSNGGSSPGVASARTAANAVGVSVSKEIKTNRPTPGGPSVAREARLRPPHRCHSQRRSRTGVAHSRCASPGDPQKSEGRRPRSPPPAWPRRAAPPQESRRPLPLPPTPATLLPSVAASRRRVS